MYGILIVLGVVALVNIFLLNSGGPTWGGNHY